MGASLFRPTITRISVATAAIGVLAAAATHATAAVPVSAERTPARSEQVQLASATDRPNILMITTDDMSVGDLKFMPFTRRTLARAGTTMAEGLAPTPICVPARASLLTGQYATNHGARTVDGPGGGVSSFDDRGTLPVWLQAAGYRTVFAGKYLNKYGLTTSPRYIPPGWDSWQASVDLSTYRFYDTTYNLDGTVTRLAPHNSDVLAGISRREVRAGAAARRPWFMWVNYVAPHHGGWHESDDPRTPRTTLPARRHRNEFARQPLPRRPEMFKGGGSPWAGTHVGPRMRANYREMYQQRLEALQSVDEAVRSTVRELRRTDQLDDTYIIFTSDNGYLTGDHNRSGKLVPYDRSLRIPIIIRGPGIPRGATSRTPVTNPDIAAIIAAIADATPTRAVDGVDVLPWLESRTTQERVIPIRAWSPTDQREEVYRGVRVGPWTYVRTPSGHEVLFNRDLDPAELRNLARSPAHAEDLARMRALEQRYGTCAGATCHDPGASVLAR